MQLQYKSRPTLHDTDDQGLRRVRRGQDDADDDADWRDEAQRDHVRDDLALFDPVVHHLVSYLFPDLKNQLSYGEATQILRITSQLYQSQNIFR